MTERQTGADESSTDRTSRRNTLRVVAGAGATGILGSLAGCEESLNELKPAGQTVVYKTPQGELREGTLGFSATNETTATTTPDTRPIVDADEYVASAGNTRGRLSLSPDATEVTYVDADNSGWGTGIAFQSLSGGDERHSRSDLQNYWQDDVPNSITLGNILSLDWCSASGSDKLAVTIDGRSELNGKLLFEFARGSTEMQLFKSASRPNVFAPNLAWSPSCDKIVYRQEGRRRTSDAPLTVLTVGSSTNAQRAKNGEDPAWGDTGIAFVRDGNVYLDRQSGPVQLTASSATDSNPVIFEQDPGESLAFQRGNEIYLIERIDQLGSSPNPSPTKVATDQSVTTFDIVD